MAKLLVCIQIVLISLVFTCDCGKTSQYVSYNSSDLSYLSNGIQFPIEVPLEQDPIIEEVLNENLPEMQWMSQLYNHHNWNKRLAVLENKKCRSEILDYLNHLNNGTLWAVKMHDASGRYSSQFFFGNDYWLGSSTLCKELNIDESKFDLPPFKVSFYVAKIRININDDLTPVTRQLNLGQCLPMSCTVGDVRRLLVQEQSQATSLTVVDVRAVPGNYSFFEDFKFYIMGGISLFVCLLVVLASGLEYHFNQCAKINDIELTCNNNNNNTTKESLKIKDIPENCTKKKENSKSDYIIQLILCFSAITNGKKIINTHPQPSDSINSLHGLRFFSIAWIILVHTYLEVFAIADNKTLRAVTERSSLYQTISNATFSVDTFFFISGLLVTVGYLRHELRKLSKPAEIEKCVKDDVKDSVVKYCMLMFYRYIRLTPAYLYVLGLNELVLKYFHSVSVFSPAIIDNISCAKYWWRNALYINNLFPQHEFCMLWSWYMANDTQFFALAIIFLAIGVRNSRCLKLSVAAIIVFLISSWITTYLIATQYNYMARIEEPFALFNELYDKPWLRIGPYLIGMITGYLIIKIEKPLVIPKVIVAIGWILSLSCLLSLVYGLGKDGLVLPVSAIYAALGHTAWALSIAWITIACYTGYGGPFNSILSFRGFLPLSRLTYCAYLAHPMIMCITSFQLDGPLHIHQGLIFVIYCGNLVVSFCTALIISLVMEAPFVRLLKIITKKV